MKHADSFFRWKVSVINLLKDGAGVQRLTSVQADEMQKFYERGYSPEEFVESLMGTVSGA